MSLSIQWLTLGTMLMSGVGMGIIFDGYRVVSSEFKFPRWSLSLLDLLYWIASAMIVFRMLYVSNNGEVRAYVFVGLAIGVVVYYWLFSKATTKITLWLINAVKWCIQVIANVFHFIVIKPILVIWAILLYIMKLGSKITIGIGKLVLQLLRPFIKLTLWILSPITKPLGRWLNPYWEKSNISTKLAKMWNFVKQKSQSWLRRK